MKLNEYEEYGKVKHIFDVSQTVSMNKELNEVPVWSLVNGEEIQENAPALGGTEDIDLADKTVHAAYIIPFKSDWTWYMIEYDPEMDNFLKQLELK